MTVVERRVLEGRFKSETFKTNERLRRLELKRVFPGESRSGQSAIRNNDSRAPLKFTGIGNNNHNR